MPWYSSLSSGESEVDPRYSLVHDDIDEEVVVKRSHTHKLGNRSWFRGKGWLLKTEYLLLMFGILNLIFIVANVFGYLTLRTLLDTQPASSELKLIHPSLIATTHILKTPSGTTFGMKNGNSNF